MFHDQVPFHLWYGIEGSCEAPIYCDKWENSRSVDQASIKGKVLVLQVQSWSGPNGLP